MRNFELDWYEHRDEMEDELLREYFSTYARPLRNDFRYWIQDYTGLTLYDFRVLDNGTSECEVKDLFHACLEDKAPTPQTINKAIEDALSEGFEVTD